MKTPRYDAAVKRAHEVGDIGRAQLEEALVADVADEAVKLVLGPVTSVAMLWSSLFRFAYASGGVIKAKDMGVFGERTSSNERIIPHR